MSRTGGGGDDSQAQITGEGLFGINGSRVGKHPALACMELLNTDRRVMIFAVGQHIPRKARCSSLRTCRNPGVPRIPGSGRSGSRRRKARLCIRCSFCLVRDRHGGAPGCVSRLRFRSPATYESPRRPAGALATVPADSEFRVALRNPRAGIVASLFEELAGLEAFIGFSRLRHAAGHPENRQRNHHDSHAMHYHLTILSVRRARSPLL